MLKLIFNFVVPAAAVFFAFKLGGALIGAGVSVLIAIMLIHKKLPDIYMLLAQYNYQKNNDKAFGLMEKAYKTGRLSPDHMLYYSYLCLREGRLEKSERLINAVLAYKRTPEIKCRAKTNQALLLWKQGKLDEAVDILWEVYENYKTTVVYGNLGYLLLLKGDLQKALEFNLEAYDYNSANNIITDNLAQNYYLLGDFQKSLELYEELMESKPEFPVPYYNYAKTLYALGRKEEALKALETSLSFKFTFLAAVTRAEVEELMSKIRQELPD